MPIYLGSTIASLYLGDTPITAVYVGDTLLAGGAPTITSLSSSGAGASTSPSVTITGTNFSSGASVSVGGSAASSVTVNSSTSITCTFPARSRGEYTVTVTTSGGTSNGAAFRYISPPVITGFSPNPVAPGGVLTITGYNFNSGLLFYVSTATGYPYYTPSGVTSTSAQITLSNVNTGSCDITPVQDFDGWGTGGTVSIVAVPAPTITSISVGKLFTGDSVTVSGTNLTGGSVSIGGTAVTATVSATSASFTCPNLGSDGNKTISVTTAGGTATSALIGFYAPRAAETTTFSTQGTFSYTTQVHWRGFEVMVLGGGGGGDHGGAGFRNGGGGGAGSWASGALDNASANTTRTLTVIVGNAGTGGTVAGTAPTGGGTSYVQIEGGSYLAIGSGGAAKAGTGVQQNGYAPGNSGGYTGGSAGTGNGGNATAPGAGGAGGTGFLAGGFSKGGNGSSGRVWIRAYQ